MEVTIRHSHLADRTNEINLVPSVNACNSFNIIYFFQIPQFPVIPAVTPLAGLDTHPPNLSDMAAANVPPKPTPSQYFPPAVILPSFPMNPALPLTSGSPALPMQAVNLPHTTVASLILPCQTIVPNMPSAPIPLLAVPPSGVTALPTHHAVAQLSQQQLYQATFQQIIQNEVLSSPHHTQNMQAVSQQQQLPPLPQSLQPSIIHPSEQTMSASGAGNQVICLNWIFLVLEYRSIAPSGGSINMFHYKYKHA